MAQVQLRKKHRFFRREDISLWLMALPTILFLLIFCYAPMFGLIMAFQNLNVAKGILASPFVGFKNFEFLFATTDAWIITRNTVCYNLVFICVNMFFAVLLALLLSELTFRKTAKALQTIYMLPYFLSWAVVSIILIAFLDRDYGLVNAFIRMTGARGMTDWYAVSEICRDCSYSSTPGKMWATKRCSICRLSPAFRRITTRPPYWTALPNSSRPGTSPCRTCG